MLEDAQQEYRVYCHDGVHHVVSAEWVDAGTDEEAIAAVQQLYPKLHCELWQDRRLVAKLVSSRPAA